MIRLAIDIGSGVTKIYMTGCGVVLSEATCVAVEEESGSVRFKAFGDRARALAGKSARYTRIVCPVKDGEIADMSLLVPLMTYFFGKIEIKPQALRKCDVIFVLPCGYGKRTAESYMDLSDRLGIGRVTFTALPFAAVTGHNVRLSESVPVFCVDIGHSVTDIAALSLDGIISGLTVGIGSSATDAAIASYASREFGLQIGSLTAEKLKISIGNLLKNDEKADRADGVSTVDGSPASCVFRASQIHDIVQDCTDKILEYVTRVINGLSAEVSSEISSGGIYLSGGGAKCEGLAAYMEERLHMPVHLSEEPSLAAVIGAGTIFSSDALCSKIAFPGE